MTCRQQNGALPSSQTLRLIRFQDASPTLSAESEFLPAPQTPVHNKDYTNKPHSGNGSAKLIAPTSGFQDAALYSLFPNSSDGQTSATGTATGAPVDTSSSSSSSSNTGAIAGGVIGGLAGIALLGAGLFFLRRRRRQQPAPAYTAGDPAIEAGSQSLYEKDGTLKVNHELQGDAAFREDNLPLAEMPGGISTHPPLELPGESAPQREPGASK
jgi:LPXTG-motif cell wall-anchored protein